MSQIHPAPKPATVEKISQILEVSRKNNARDGITGLLVFHDQVFFQVLEGDQKLIESCFQRIQLDARNHSTSLIWKGHVERRIFSNWAMGYADPMELDLQSRESLRSIVNLKRDKMSILAGPSVAAQLANWMLRDISNIH